MEQFALTDEQKMLRETIAKVAREKVAPRAAEIDAKAEYPQDMFDLLKSLDLFALPFPEEYGGGGRNRQKRMEKFTKKYDLEKGTSQET